MSTTPPPADGRDPALADLDWEAEFGPGGYLPRKAAQRARKIVLREQMGLHWPVAAVVAGLAIVAVVLPLVLSGSSAPGPPFVDVGPLDQVDPRGDARLTVEGTEVLVVRGGGVLVAFADPPSGVAYCPASRRIESPSDQAVWSLRGVPLGGSLPPLVRVEARAVDDHLYLDLESRQSVAGTGDGSRLPDCP